MKNVGFKIRFLFMAMLSMNASYVFSQDACWIDNSISTPEGRILLGQGRSLSLETATNSINVGQALGDSNQEFIFYYAIKCEEGIRKKQREAWGGVTGFQKSSVMGSFDGKPSAVFETGVDGVGFSVAVTDTNRQWVFWDDISSMMWTDTYDGPLSVKARYIYVLTKPLKSGAYNIPQLTIGTYDIHAEGMGKVSGFPIIIPAGKIEVVTRTCTLDGPEQDNINFGNISFDIIKDGKSNANVIRHVTCDDKVGDREVEVHFTLSDKNSIDNRGTYLKNKTGGGYAKGVGVEVSLNGTPIKLGPISSDKGTENQQRLGSGSQKFTLNAKPVFIPGEEFATGKLDATAVLTMSYQ